MEKDIIQAYVSGASAQEVADSFEIGLAKVYYLLKKQGIHRRSPREANQQQFLRKPMSFQLLEHLTTTRKIEMARLRVVLGGRS